MCSSTSILMQYYEKTRELQYYLDQANSKIKSLAAKIKKLEPENERLRDVERNYNTVERVLGKERVDKIISAEKVKEQNKNIVPKIEQLPKKQNSNRYNDYVR